MSCGMTTTKRYREQSLLSRERVLRSLATDDSARASAHLVGLDLPAAHAATEAEIGRRASLQAAGETPRTELLPYVGPTRDKRPGGWIPLGADVEPGHGRATDYVPGVRAMVAAERGATEARRAQAEANRHANRALTKAERREKRRQKASKK